MTARSRFLQVGVGVLLVLALIVSLSTYAARDNLIRYTLNPNRDFGEGQQPAAPDYRQASSWLDGGRGTPRDVDVFFIYPSVYFSGEYWNAPVGTSSVRERLQGVIRPLYAGPFIASANLHMPLYRQAAPYSFMGSSENGRSARELAYADVARAFDVFLASRSDGRPFIIAGYGQGALYGFRLVAELDPEVRRRMVAAYLLEVAIPMDTVRAMAKGTPLCDTPDQTGCLVIWHSTTPNARGDMPRQNALVWKPGGGLDATRGRELACVNPLTWSISGRAGSIEMNLGAGELSGFGTGQVVVTHAQTSADCWNGLLFTDIVPDPIFFWAGPRYRELFPSSVNPFYADIKDNVARRIESYQAQGSASDPEDEPEAVPEDTGTALPEETTPAQP